MKEAKRLPSDWDWVTARDQCSAVKAFELLRLDAEGNVKTMNATKERTNAEWQFAANNNTFSIVRRAFQGIVGVRFHLAGDEISIESQGIQNTFKATLTLNEDGACRFLVGGQELDRWQVLKRALEPLFFGRDPL